MNEGGPRGRTQIINHGGLVTLILTITLTLILTMTLTLILTPRVGSDDVNFRLGAWGVIFETWAKI